MKFLDTAFYALLLLLVLSCQNKPESRSAGEHPMNAPYDWMYHQRAYPHHQLNYEVYAEAVAQVKKAKNSLVLRDEFQWELVGPVNIGGRITDVALHPGDQNIIYAGASVGGLFKSTDGGENWQAIFENEGVLSIGNIALAPSNPDVIYVGTGEANSSFSSGAFFGTGMFKSSDAGASWQHIGLENSNHIGRVIVHPQDENKVYVAVAGLLYGAGSDKGLYRSADGGENWEQVLYINDSTSVIDVALDYTDPDILYAASWERIRRPWQRSYGGPSSGIWRSLDGGDTWEKLSNGLPLSDDNMGRIGLATSPAQPGLVYATFTTNPITNVFNGVYRSEDFGVSWSRVDNGFDLEDVFASFGWFFGNIRIDPNDVDRVFVLGVPLMRTVNGGASWSEIGFSNHVDNHALEIHPLNSNFMVCGNDGGLYISQNGGQAWTHVETLPINQFYNAEVDPNEPNRVYGGAQDNGTLRTLTGSTNDWERILGGDGFHVKVDPNNSNIVYAEYQWGNMFGSVDGGNSFDYLFGGQGNDRTNWNTPFLIDPNSSNTLYYGANVLYRSDDYGQSWQAISPDLTDGQHPSGSTSFGTISAIAVASANSDLIYVGTDDGNVQKTSNGGQSWTNVSNGIPDRYVTSVAFDPNDENTVFVTLSGYRWVDYQPHVLRSVDGGLNWEDISANLPEIPVNDIIIDPASADTYYLANDLGVWYTTTAGEVWEIMDASFPATVVNDLVFHEETRYLYAATFGRSILKTYVGEPVSERPVVENAIQLLEIAPNPVVHQANIRFTLDVPQEGRLELYGLSGQKLRDIARQYFPAGENRVKGDFSNLPTGTYVLRFFSKEQLMTSKVVVR